jgi:hypothetical protein
MMRVRGAIVLAAGLPFWIYLCGFAISFSTIIPYLNI